MIEPGGKFMENGIIVPYGFNSGEQVVYSTSGTEISGISTSSVYYLTKIDDNNFKLSEEYSGTNKLFYYEVQVKLVILLGLNYL